MRYIKTYESFKTNETMDMFTMPVDPIKGAADVYGEIWNSMKDYAKKGVDFLEDMFEKTKDFFVGLADMMKIPLENLLEKVEKYFASPAHDLNFKQIVDILMKKNPLKGSITESRESEMEAHMDIENTKDIGQKVLSVLKAIFGINAFGGLVVVLVNWITELISGFDIMGWLQTQTWVQNSVWFDAATNPGSRGFIPVWLIYSLVAMLILHLIKKFDAWVVTSDTYKKNF
jgi:hypothetical protein